MNYILADNKNTLELPTDCRIGSLYLNELNNLDRTITIDETGLEFLSLINQDLSINSSPVLNLVNSQSSITSVVNLASMGTVGETIIANGNLQVLGTLTSVDSLDVKDPLISTGVGNLTNTVDLGIYSQYSLDGKTSLYSGVARDHLLSPSTTSTYVVFDTGTQPTSVLPAYTLANLQANQITANLVGNVSGNLTGSVLTASQTAITTVGSLVSLLMAGDINLDGNNINSVNNINATTLIGDLTGNVLGNLTGNVAGDLTGNVLTSDQSGITKVGTLLGLICSGQVEFNYNTASSNNLVVQNPSTAVGIVIKAVNPSVNESAIIKIGSTALQANGWNIGQSSSSNTVKDFYIRDVQQASYRLLCNTNGNFTLGGSDLATTNYKLYADGASFINGALTINGILSGVSDLTATNIAGTLTTVSQPNITTLAGITSIQSVAISGTQFGYLGALNQSLTTSSNVQFGNITGTLLTTSQPNITTVGTITTLTTSPNQFTTQLQGVGDGSGGTIISRGFNDSNAYGGGVSGSRARNTISSPTGVIINDVLCGMWGKGYHSTGGYNGNTGAIRIVSGETFTSSSANTFIDFATTPTGSAGRSIRMIINGAGNISIGSSDLAGSSYKLYTDGAMYLNGALTINGNLAGIGTLTSTTIRQSDGSVGTPSISFTNDTDTGFYRVGSNQIGLVLGGTGYTINSTVAGNLVGLYQSSSGTTTQNLVNITSTTAGNSSVMSVYPAYQWTGSFTATTTAFVNSTASFEIKLPVSAGGALVVYAGGCISGETDAGYLLTGRITSATQTYLAINLTCNNIWAISSTLYVNYSIQYRIE